MRGDAVGRCIEALRAGEAVLLPADGVYGLCVLADQASAAAQLYELKSRDAGRPIALFAARVDVLFECVPELPAPAQTIVRTLLPGPYTLVLPNPARRYEWLNGTNPDAIGVRVADVPAVTQQVLGAVGPVAATSANESGEPSAARLDDVPERIRSACGAELDAGGLSGEPSTVIDFTGPEPVVLREGSAPSGEAIALVRAALATRS